MGHNKSNHPSDLLKKLKLSDKQIGNIAFNLI